MAKTHIKNSFAKVKLKPKSKKLKLGKKTQSIEVIIQTLTFLIAVIVFIF